MPLKEIDGKVKLCCISSLITKHRIFSRGDCSYKKILNQENEANEDFSGLSVCM
jgi:hypothetical protein